MGEPDSEFEGRTIEVFRYLVERLRKYEAELETLRASEARCRQYLEHTLENYEDTEREAQTIRDILYPATGEGNE